jgi:hypothetical protein
VASSIFRTALSPDREKGQYIATSRELAADAVLMFLAGTDTTAHALTFGTWEMIKRPELWTKLRQEVTSILPETSQGLARLTDLENLPFLVSGNQEDGVPEIYANYVNSPARCGERIPSVFYGDMRPSSSCCAPARGSALWRDCRPRSKFVSDLDALPPKTHKAVRRGCPSLTTCTITTLQSSRIHFRSDRNVGWGQTRMNLRNTW